MAAGLYIHVPYCIKKCRYCDFYSLACKPGEAYVNAVIKALGAYDGVSFDTVYFGGGTPSLLSPGQVYDILSGADISPMAEVSMECNPGSVREGYFRELRQAGVNRLSFGVQSFNDRELSLLGRLHNADEAERAVLSAAGEGFDNISIDLMLGIPGQDMESLGETLSAAARLPVSHVSAYMLKIEDGTPLSRDTELLRLIPDDDTAADMYLMTVDRLSSGAQGFEQYEISNFSRRGAECRHNLKYWHCEEYIGIGPAAHSFYGGRRYETPRDLAAFLSDPTAPGVTEGYEGGSVPGGLHERFMLMMRLSEGFPVEMAGEAELLKAALPLERAGLLKVSGGRIALTPRGFLVSNEIILRLSEVLPE